MTSRSLLLLTLLGVMASVGGIIPRARAQASAPPVDPATVLATLKDLKAKQAGFVSKEKAGVLNAINAAIADPAKAYEQAMAAVNLKGNEEVGRNAVGTPGNAPNGRGFDSRRRNGNGESPRDRTAELLRDRNFIDAVRLHLTYLALTWQHSMGIKVKDQLGGLMNYASQVDNSGELYVPYEMLRKPLGESLFVIYFQIGPYLTKSADWEDRPFNTEGIFEKTILPALRAQKDPRLLELWNGRVATETARASATQNALAVNRYNNVRRPTLLWNRAEDELLLGQTNQAVADMMALIKAHADHPDFDQWVKRVTEIVTPPPKGEVTVGPATTPGLTTPAL